MSTSIYDHHGKAFVQVSAYVVLSGNERVATIAFKFPKDGASRLWVYVHWIGTEMVRGYAGGFGYDKQSAACANAAPNIKAETSPTTFINQPEVLEAFKSAIAHDGGERWDTALRNAGFTVLQAV